GISEELRRLLHELARVAKVLYAFSGDPSHAASRTFSNFAQSFEHAARAQLESEGDRETWAAAIDIKAGPWALHLTGTAVPKCHREIGLRKDQEAELPAEAFLTLVRPARDFELVHLDSSGNGKVALPRGESIVLVQSNEIWEIRLSYG